MQDQVNRRALLVRRAQRRLIVSRLNGLGWLEGSEYERVQRRIVQLMMSTAPDWSAKCHHFVIDSR